MKLGSIKKLTKKNTHRSIKTCYWARLFINLTINEKVEFLSNTLINRFMTYVTKKKFTFKCSEALWINKNIKSALRKRSTLTKRYYVNGLMQSDHNLLLSHPKKIH